MDKPAPRRVGLRDESPPRAAASPPGDLSLRRIFSLWFPLALSFELMMMEGPSLQAAVGRLADTQLNLAAWGLTISLSLLVESPVIMLLATSIALTRNAQAYRVLRRFVIDLCLGCTVVAAALSFTPLYGIVTGTIMRQPAPIAEAARPALRIMLLWTAAIGYRRFYQGILVRASQTSRVSWGTAVRLSSVVLTALSLVHWGHLPGVQVAAASIMVGVIGEAVVTRLFAAGAVRALSPAADDSLTVAKVMKFHMPLAATTLLTLLAQPLTAAALAWLPHAEQTLAAWPVAFMALLVIRGWGLALQEITVSRARDPHARAPLARFTWIVGGVTSAVAALLAFTPLLDVYLVGALHVPENLHDAIALGIGLCCLQPLVTALSSWLRGALMAVGATRAVYAGMGLSLAAQAVLLIGSIVVGVSGMYAAAASFMGASLVELAYLRMRAVREGAIGPSVGEVDEHAEVVGGEQAVGRVGDIEDDEGLAARMPLENLRVAEDHVDA